MSLAHATHRGEALGLIGPGPFPCAWLDRFVGQRLTLACEDRFVRGTGDEAHAYLDGSRDAWLEHPEYMDFLDPASPIHAFKVLERDLVLHHWARWLADARLVLDVGCGIGRFAMPLLDRGLDVVGVDADLESLRRFVWHAAGRAGRVDVCWSSVHVLPDLLADVAIVSEVLCYVPDAASALRGIAERVRPGGTVLVSVEARWGWAVAQDAPPGTLDAALGGAGVVSAEGRWVRTYEAPALRTLIAEAGLELLSVVPSHWVLDGPLEGVAPPAPTLEQVLLAEATCASHPVWAPLHRLWLVAGRVPGR